jgi:hypothetical protein
MRFGEMRASGVCDVLIYCADYRCTHHMMMSADRWPDHVRPSDIEPDFVCTACGKRGADVRSKFPHAKMGTRWCRGLRGQRGRHRVRRWR